MGFDTTRDIQILERTPGVLSSMLHGLDDHWIRSNYGPNTWSPIQIVAHVLHNELNDWIPRLRWVLERGESLPFPAYDPSGNVAFASQSVDELLDSFAAARSDSLDELRATLSPAVLMLKGAHPAFGIVTVDELLCAWVVHDLHHIAQLAKAVARQHTDDVGPWSRYISIIR